MFRQPCSGVGNSLNNFLKYITHLQPSTLRAQRVGVGPALDGLVWRPQWDAALPAPTWCLQSLLTDLQNLPAAG